MRQAARLAVIGLTAMILAGCTAGVPATIDPPATTESEQVIAQAPTTVPDLPISTLAPATEPPATEPPPTATTAPAPTSEPVAPAVDADLSYRAQAEGRPAPPPPADGSLLTIPRGPSGRLEVALTFDAGADRGYAAEILDLLRDYGLKGTFGMTGLWAENNPDLIQRMVDEGHQLMNHTYDHASLTGASTGLDPQTYDSVLWQLNQTEQIVWDIAGYQMKPYMRPPYGDYGPETSSYLVDAGYYINVMWTCDSFGWKGWDAAQIIAHCTTDIGPGEIILLHVGASAPGDFESLPGMIDAFSQAGYRFVTIEQMLQP